MMKLPVVLSVPPMTLAPISLVIGMDSPVTMDSSTAERPSITSPSTAIFSPGRTRSRSPTAIASSDTSSSPPSALKRRAVLGARSSKARIARTQLEHLTEQHEAGDDGCSLEIDGNRPFGTVEFRRKHAGQQDRGHAVKPRYADAHGDQREHVQIAREKRLPAAHEERGARPQHYRRGE